MGKGRGDDEDEVEVEGVDDAFEDAHQSDDEEYDANAIEEESDDEEEDANVLSPSKIKLAKEDFPPGVRRLSHVMTHKQGAKEWMKAVPTACIPQSSMRMGSMCLDWQ